MTAAGTVDVFWNWRAALLRVAPDRFRILQTETDHKHAGFLHATFDGEYIWTITCCKGVNVFDRDGKRIAHLDVGETLPASDQGARLGGIRPGEIVAVGSFGKDCRAWCAKLTLKSGVVECRKFHEATTVYANAKELTGKKDKLDTVFIPAEIYSVPRGSTPSFLVFRQMPAKIDSGSHAPAFLRIDADQLTVDLVDYGLNSCRQPQFAFAGHECFWDPGVPKCYPGPGSGKRAAQRNGAASPMDDLSKRTRLLPGNLACVTIPASPERRAQACIVAWNQSIYAPGDTWLRIDPVTKSAERLGPWPAYVREPANGYRVGVSALSGLVLWDSNGLFCRVAGGLDRAEADRRRDQRVAALRSKIVADPSNAAARAALIRDLSGGGRGDQAKAECLDWIRREPHRVEARFALRDVERRRIYQRALGYRP